MPVPNVHSLSAAVAGFVIAAYWIVYIVTIVDTYSAYPSPPESGRPPDRVEAGACSLDGALASTPDGACRSMATIGAIRPNG